MKLLRLSAMVFSLILLTACLPEGMTSGNSKKIIGTWEVAKHSKEMKLFPKSLLTFSQDGKLSIEQYATPMVGVYSVKGSDLEFTSGVGTSDEKKLEMSITTLTDSDLILTAKGAKAWKLELKRK